jgi:putative ABC transport system permease protein
VLLLESTYIALKEIRANKIRSFLSVLGIIIGIVALVVMMAIMAGVESQWVDYIDHRGGIRKATIRSITPVVDGEKREDLFHELTLDDVYAIKRRKRIVEYVSPEIKKNLLIQYQGRRYYPPVAGANRDTLGLNRLNISQGRPISEEDLLRVRNVCVIGTAIRDYLFGYNQNPVGKIIDIEGHLFEVVGLIDKNVIMRGKRNIIGWKNLYVYIPLTVWQNTIDPDSTIKSIHYSVIDRRKIARAKKEIMRIIAQNHQMVEDIQIETQLESLKGATKSLNNMKIGYSLIAGISLVVGGIGIMNVMMASISQRITEIGIRKAVGARSRDIGVQFLIESVLVSVIGGIVGIVSSIGIVIAIKAVVSSSQLLVQAEALMLAAFFSLLVGIGSGIYPAIKAASLNPIQALRFQ